ncbi:MAG TPA: hypothetical protein VFI20_05990 [Terracidiphilus sp.]|nr:hypothetical protein [Terracidiphilus sp.]
MVTLHAFLSLGAGFAVAIAGALGLRGLLGWLAPSLAATQARPGLSYTVVNLGASFLAGAAGGYVTAWTARGNSLVQVLALALIVLALAALSALQGRGQQPIWYQLAQVALSPVGVLAGGLVRLRMTGVLM